MELESPYTSWRRSRLPNCQKGAVTVAPNIRKGKRRARPSSQGYWSLGDPHSSFFKQNISSKILLTGYPNSCEPNWSNNIRRTSTAAPRSRILYPRAFPRLPDKFEAIRLVPFSKKWSLGSILVLGIPIEVRIRAISSKIWRKCPKIRGTWKVAQVISYRPRSSISFDSSGLLKRVKGSKCSKDCCKLFHLTAHPFPSLFSSSHFRSLANKIGGDKIWLLAIWREIERFSEKKRSCERWQFYGQNFPELWISGPKLSETRGPTVSALIWRLIPQ